MQPAESNLEFSTHTRNSPSPVCHLLDGGSDAFTNGGRYTLCYLFHRYKSSQCQLCLPFFTHMPRAARSSKSTLGAVKLGQLLHRLVSKPCYVSLRGFQFGILMEVIEVIEASVQTNKRLIFLCTTPNKDPIGIICLNQPLLLHCCHNSLFVFDFKDLRFWVTDAPSQITQKLKQLVKNDQV